MKIACLGWGSLVWTPKGLLIRREWFLDGPFLPVEFCRKSDDGRLTLVITPGKPELRTLWALFSTPDLDKAIESLQERENLKGKNKDKNTGVWPSKPKYAKACPNIVNWARNMNLDAVVWTALGPRFQSTDDVLSEDQAVEYLTEKLCHEKRCVAEEYIRRTPVQIDTEFRRRFEREFGWKPIE